MKSVAIKASAGCGKTYEMILRLLAMVVKDRECPERFFRAANTMTFTKAATAEIYTELLKKIYTTLLAQDYDNLNSELKLFGVDEKVGKSELLEILKFLIINMSTIKITTIDSFMNSIIQSFPFELGLPGNCTIVDDGMKQQLKERIIHRLFCKKQFDMEEFRQSCELALTSDDKKTHLSIFNDFIQMIDNLYVIHPDFKFQRYDGLISNREIKERQKNLEESLERCNKHFENNSLYKKNGNKAALFTILSEFIVKNESLNIAYVFPSEILKEIRHFFTNWEEFLATSSLPNYKKKWDFAPVKDDVIAILELARDILISQSAARAEGIYRIYEEYQKLYREEFYKHGYLTFADFPKLLANEDNDWTYDIAYRMNNRFRHWLVDEFQDTSRMQWSVLEKMIDIADEESEKSLFFVGDTKQAIYSWRAGDRRLFDEVIDWAKEFWNLEMSPKNQSQRYGINICKMVNEIFDGKKMLQNAQLQPKMREAWNNVFVSHTPAERLKYNSLFECIAFHKSDLFSTTQLYAEVIAAKIRQAQVLEKGYSCAVLVRNRKEGQELAELLSQKEEFFNSVVWEGDGKLAGDKFIDAVLALLIYLQHPGDILSREIASMDIAIRHLVPKNSEELRLLNEELSNNGISFMVKKFIRKLKGLQNIYCGEEIHNYLTLDNVEDLLTAARDFEVFNSTYDTIDFKTFVESRKRKDAPNGKIRIMTIFHSKGLTFDFCFYASDPSVKNKNITAFDYGDGHLFDGKHIFYPSAKEHACVPELKAVIDDVVAEKTFETMCVAYVAMTRARYATIVLLPPLSNNKQKTVDQGEKIYNTLESYYISDFIRDSIGSENFVAGALGEISFDRCIESNNFNVLTLPAKEAEKSEQVLNFAFADEIKFRRKRINPSKDDTETMDSKKLYFNLPKENSASNLGDKIHELFSQVIDIKSFELPANLDEEVKIQFLLCMKNPEIRALLSAEMPDDVWLEKRFDCIINDGWVSGCFDRVNLIRNDAGKVIRAQLIDYKSSYLDDDNYGLKVKNYKRQLNLYRDVLAKILKLSTSDIDCFMIFCRYGKMEKF